VLKQRLSPYIAANKSSKDTTSSGRGIWGELLASACKKGTQLLCRNLRRTPEGVVQHSPGSRQPPWEKSVAPMIYPEGVAQKGGIGSVQPFGLDEPVRSSSQALTRFRELLAADSG